MICWLACLLVGLFGGWVVCCLDDLVVGWFSCWLIWWLAGLVVLVLVIGYGNGF